MDLFPKQYDLEKQGLEKKKKKKKKIKYAFRPTTRWIIRSNNEILRKN